MLQDEEFFGAQPSPARDRRRAVVAKSGVKNSNSKQET
jgi:hypothetical protein